MAEGKTLIVVEDETAIPEERETADQVLVLFDEYLSVDFDRVHSTFGQFAATDFESGTDLPVYRILWGHFVDSTNTCRHNFVDAVNLFELLADEIEDNNIDHVRAVNLDRFYELLLLDVARELDVETNVRVPHKNLANVVAYLGILVGILPFLIDQLLSFMIRPFIRGPKSVRTVFAVSPGRLESIGPVIEAFDDPYEVVPTPMTTALLLSSDLKARLQPYDILPPNVCLSARHFILEIRFVVHGVSRVLLTERRLAADLESFIFSEFGYRMEFSTWWLVNNLLNANAVRSLCYYFVYDAVFARTLPKTVVTNTAAPPGRALMAAGRDRGLSVFHVPHSDINKKHSPEPSFLDCTVFLSGSGAERFFEEHLQYMDDTNGFEPLGRPYLDRLQSSGSDTEGGRLRIVIAPSPLRETIRREFIETVLETLSAVGDPVDVLIKTHPGEDPAFYDPYRREYDFVAVRSDGLYDALGSGDLVITINSNVGLEAMVLGTPTVCVNLWEPWTWNMGYAEMGPVPILQSTDDVRDFFDDLNTETLASLRRDQRAFVEAEYVLDGSAAAAIARYIENANEDMERSGQSARALHSG